MKKILLILLICSGLSCSKDSSPNVCYICVLGNSPDGEKHQPQTVCGEGAQYTQFRDSRNNDLTSTCTKK